jgi:hypothetical protein
MEITCQSRISILLSLKEGSNRAITESMFCNVPVIILDEHVGGIRKNIVPQTGEIAPQKELHRVINSMLDNLTQYSPRHWALNNISCFESTKKLNSFIKEHMLKDNYYWSHDIVVHSNSPESKYVDKDNYEKFRSAHKALTAYFLDFKK